MRILTVLLLLPLAVVEASPLEAERESSGPFGEGKRFGKIAQEGAEPRAVEPPAAPRMSELKMNNRRLGRLIEAHFPGLRIEGGRGAWRIELPEPQGAGDEAEANGQAPKDDPPAGQEEAGPGADDHLPPMVVILTDERADRMRIMMPIRPFDPEQVEDLRLALIALHANYDRALDARYALQDGVLWSVFIHPLGSLTSDDFANALRQVQTLRKSTGTTYSSGDLLFGPGIAPEVTDPEDDAPRA